MADKNYYHVKWSAYAEVDGQRVDISDFSITYQLDSIPSATFTPVVGRDGRTGQEAEAVDALLNSAPYSPIKIYVRGETEQDSPQAPSEPGFPYDEDTLIFDGFYQGVEYVSQRQLGSGVVQLRGAAFNWLLGLHGTSAATNKTTIKGPGGFFEVANIGLSVNPNSANIFNLSTAISGNPETAVDDLWKQFIKPLFLEIVNQKEVWGDAENDSALEALTRMDQEEQFGTGNELLLSFGNIRGDVSKKQVAEWLVANLARNLFSAWRNSSLWGALLWAARTFTFKIVPLIDTATCAPVFGALGAAAYIIVAPDEYHDINIRFTTPQLITKVVVVSNNMPIVDPWLSAPRLSAVVGQASADDVSVIAYEGVAIRVNAPDWLGSEPMVGELTKVSLGKNQIGIPDAISPASFQYTPTDEEDYPKIFNTFIRSEMGDAYARLVLLDYMLKDRSGTITGRFRTDISPGSTIAVEVIGGGKFSATTGDPRYLYGLVEAVTLNMNGGSGGTGSASTSLILRNVMTAQEHDGYLGILTEDRHPIFDAAFVGAKLTGE